MFAPHEIVENGFKVYRVGSVKVADKLKAQHDSLWLLRRKLYLLTQDTKDTSAYTKSQARRVQYNIPNLRLAEQVVLW